MSKFFGAVNKVDSNKKSRQYDLVLDKLFVTQCGWVQLCTTVSMVITSTNIWKLFRYGVNKDHHEKLIGII